MKADKHIAVAAAPFLASREYLDGLKEILARLDTALIDKFTEVIWEGYEKGKTLFVFGNGGSAALASHFVCDIAKGTVTGARKRLKAISLVDNVPMMTAWANDHGYEGIFAEQLSGLVERGDLVLAISGSGNSKNVLRGLEVARAAGAKTLVLTGYAGGKAKDLADLCLVVSSDSMQHIEDAHLCAAHAIFHAVRHRMLRENHE